MVLGFYIYYYAQPLPRTTAHPAGYITLNSKDAQQPLSPVSVGQGLRCPRMFPVELSPVS